MSLSDRWIEIFRSGNQVDSEGRSHQITADFLDSVVRNYDPAIHEAPAVIGHPIENAPAYAWTKGLRVRDGVLEVQFKDVDSNFAEIVSKGYFKKRSASFYTDLATAPGGKVPYLRHIGFLGAQPPAVKGLRDIQFNEGESLTFDFSEGKTMDEKQEQGLVNNITDKLTEAIRSMFPGRKDEGTQASFSEADFNKKIEDAVKAATTNFGEKITALETENKDLRLRVDQQANSSTRSSLESFVGGFDQSKLPSHLRTGLVEFMEVISGVDAKVSVISFSEEGGKKIETKTESSPLAFFKNFLATLGPFIEFGERFGGLKSSGGDLGVVSEERKAELREQAGLPAKGGDK